MSKYQRSKVQFESYGQAMEKGREWARTIKPASRVTMLMKTFERSNTGMVKEELSLVPEFYLSAHLELKRLLNQTVKGVSK